MAPAHDLGNALEMWRTLLVLVVGLGCTDGAMFPPDGSLPGTDGATADAPVATSDASTDASSDASMPRDGGMVIVPPGLIFFDDFEYDVPRDAAGAAEIFIEHGWSTAKTEQDGRSGANGYVHTTNAVPGFSGALPGRESSRVLVLEALPGTLVGQTDFYVQYGDGEGPIGQIPANHWFQFWVYSPGPPDQNLFTAGKFIYPNRATFYPATIDNEGYIYLSTLSKLSGPTLGLDCNPLRSVGCEEAFFSTIWNSEAGLTSGNPDAGHHFDQNLVDVPPVIAGAWTLVRMHVDISGTDPRATPGHAVVEQWFRRLGDADWTKTTEWIGGVTVNPHSPAGAPADMRPVFTDGFRTIRIPTTVGGTTAAVGDWVDYRLYVDDFALAGAEADLPVYP